MDHIEVKTALLRYCQRFVEQRIDAAVQARNDVQSAAMSEEKSSAGDKYETGRSMMQLEGDRMSQQIKQASMLKDVLKLIDPMGHCDVVSLGSVVVTESASIFLSIGIGKANVEGTTYIIVAPESPLGKTIKGKKVNESFTFNGQQNTILNIF